MSERCPGAAVAAAAAAAASRSNLAAPADAPGVAKQLEGGRGALARLRAAGTEAAAQGGQQEGASSLHGEGLCGGSAGGTLRAEPPACATDFPPLHLLPAPCWQLAQFQAPCRRPPKAWGAWESTRARFLLLLQLLLPPLRRLLRRGFPSLEVAGRVSPNNVAVTDRDQQNSHAG